MVHVSEVMRRLLLLALLGLHGCDAPAGWTTAHDRVHGTTVSFPGDWHRAKRSLTPNLVYPTEVVAVATYPLRASAPQRCAHVPERALRDLGPTDVLVTVSERAAARLDREEFRPRTRPFGIGRPQRTDHSVCVRRHDIEEHWIPFSDAGREFYAFVGFGRKASARRRAAVTRILDSLHFTHRRGAGA
ncbi:MAG: hypothetical protein QOI80_1678 [Solirubrobacteraceae bacterium]|nr:hypothetical protein [Solirubrobacteraceae bacterium]